jgi:hypothetical protein
VADRGEFVGVADKVDGCDDAVLRRHRHHLCYSVTSRENGAGGADDDGRLGGQVAAVAASHGYEEAGYPAGADDRAASGPAFGTTVCEAYDLRRQADDDLVHVAGSQRTEQAVDEFAVGPCGLAGLLVRPEGKPVPRGARRLGRWPGRRRR